ncbi:MAG: phospholipase [Balneolaceae bacterium]|nr:phospholipase [Balneolaceae bacterium]
MGLFTVDKDKHFKGPHQNTRILQAGAPVAEAEAAMIMIHGRGAGAQSILQLASEFRSQRKIAYYAPQASGYTWYPNSFLAPTEQNEPGLSSGLQKIYDIITDLEANGIAKENTYLLGFSQGACLASEYAARHPYPYAGLIALSGGLIGDTVERGNYKGDLGGMPVFMGCSDTDPHIPKERVDISEIVFKQLNAEVTKSIYPGMGHLVNKDEIEHIRKIIG